MKFLRNLIISLIVFYGIVAMTLKSLMISLDNLDLGDDAP